MHWHFLVNLLLLAAANTASAAAPGKGVPVVGRLVSPVSDDPQSCSGDEQFAFRYEVLYAYPSSGLPDSINVSCSCQVLRGPRGTGKTRSRPVFVVGELHDLRLSAHETEGKGEHYRVVAIEQRRKPVATQISVLEGYDREQAARLLEKKLRDFSCASGGSDASFPIRLEMDPTGCVSSVVIESKADDSMVRCTKREVRKWDFGYPRTAEGQGRRRGELSFVIVYPR